MLCLIAFSSSRTAGFLSGCDAGSLDSEGERVWLEGERAWFEGDRAWLEGERVWLEGEGVQLGGGDPASGFPAVGGKTAWSMVDDSSVTSREAPPTPSGHSIP